MFFDLNLPTLIARIFVLLVAFSVHEFAHAWSADKFGDETPRMNGRLTLNPLVHLDPMGSLLLLVVGFGWARPVPVNPYALSRRSPAALMLVSLAGPLSNLVMAVIAAVPFRLGLVSRFDTGAVPGQILPTPAHLLMEFVFINLILMLFNLIPIVPLDGGRAVGALHPALWLVGLVGLGVLTVVAPNPILFFILIIGGLEAWKRWQHRGDAALARYFRIPTWQRVAVGVTYAGLAVLLALGMSATHIEKDF